MFRQTADGLGDHCKPLAVFSGPCSFNGCIQRQQIGLLCHVLDQLGDIPDPACRFSQSVDHCGQIEYGLLNAVHLCHGSIEILFSFPCQLYGALCLTGCRFGPIRYRLDGLPRPVQGFQNPAYGLIDTFQVLCIIADCLLNSCHRLGHALNILCRRLHVPVYRTDIGGYLLQGTGDFLCIGSLILSGGGNFLNAGAQLLRSRSYHLGRGHSLPQQIAKRFLHGNKRVGNFPDFVLSFQIFLCYAFVQGQVITGKPVENGCHGHNGICEGFRYEEGTHNTDDNKSNGKGKNLIPHFVDTAHGI